MASKKISFVNSEGITLSARLELPIDQKPHSYALFAHCFTCSKNLNAVKNISRSLIQNGIAVVRFDFTGLGESDGDFADTNFSSNISDLISAASYMEENLEAPKLIIGHSLGGAAVIIAGHQIKSIEAVATIGAPANPEHVTHLFDKKVEQIESEGIANVTIGGRPFTIKKQFLTDIQESNLLPIVKQLRKPLLILHSPQDMTVEIKNAALLYNAAHHPKSFVSLDGADHLLTKKEDSLYVGNLIANWVLRYIDLPDTDKLISKHQVVVQTGNDSFTSNIKAGKHGLIADEPESIGGNNFGPNPYDLLLSGLGACTSMTLQMYASRKKWDLKNVRVHLNHNKVYPEDCENCESSTSKIDLIERVIELDGNLDEKQRKRLLQIADKCPVHKTLHSKINITTVLE